MLDIASKPAQPERIQFSEYHAAGAVTGAFMLRQGRWKLIHYVGFEPELFDLETAPEESNNLTGQAEYASIQSDLEGELHQICDPIAVDQMAHADQAALIQRMGGEERARTKEMWLLLRT